jgi:hypothetical protein
VTANSQNAIHLVFPKFEKVGSARQMLLWCREQEIRSLRDFVPTFVGLVSSRL